MAQSCQQKEMKIHLIEEAEGSRASEIHQNRMHNPLNVAASR